MSNFNVDQAFVQQIVNSLANTLNQQDDVRKASEQYLNTASKTPGYASALLKISCDKSLIGQYQMDVSLAASIQFGRLVEIHWKFKDVEHAKKVSTSGFDYIILTEEDKEVVRNNIMGAIFEQIQNKPITKQFIRSLKMICNHDYPEKLPNIFGQIKQYLQTQDQLSVYTGIQGLYSLASRYEYELDSEREPLQQIIRESFDILKVMVGDMIMNKENQDALYMLHLICKVFYVSNQLQMSPYLMTGENLAPWIQFFKTILDMPCPENLSQKTDDIAQYDAQNKSIFWKIKGITCKLTYRMFMKYGDPLIVEDNELIKAFSEKFSQEYSLPLLQSHMNIVFQTKTHFVGSKALSFGIKFLSSSTKKQNTMKELKPFVDNLLYDTIVPILFITVKDVDSFESNPVDFIRSQYDFTDTLYAPKNQVQDLLVYLCNYSSQKPPTNDKGKKTKPKPDYLHQFLKYTVENLETYDQKVVSQEGADFRIKEALMYAIGTLREEIMGDKELKGQMENMLKKYIAPELKSPQPFMRLRACQTYGVFGDNIKWKIEGHVQQVSDAIFENMAASQPLPVKFYAACALELVLRNEKGREHVKSGLPVVIETYLQLMSELDSEELVAAFENIMSIFANDIHPYAINICNHLKNQYTRLIQIDIEDDDGESILAAVASFTSMRRIVDACQKHKPLLQDLQNILMECLIHSISKDGLDSIEEGIDCISLLIYHGHESVNENVPMTGTRISPALWKLYPQLLYVCSGDDESQNGGFGFEFVNQICITLKNYVSRDPKGMLVVEQGRSKSYLGLTFHFLKRCLEVNRNSDDTYLDGQSIMNFIIAIFENMKECGQGLMDSEFPQLLSFVVDELSFLVGKKAKSYRLMCLQALSASFVYNPIVTFQFLESRQATKAVFGEWFNNMTLVKKDFELRRMAMGLNRIIQTHAENQQAVPALVQSELPRINDQLMSLCLSITQKRHEVLQENREYVVKGGSEEFDSDEFNDSLDDNMGFLDEEEEFKLQQKMFSDIGHKLHTGEPLDEKQMQKYAKELDMGDDDGLDDDDSDYEYHGGESSLYDSRLDYIDSVQQVIDTLNTIHTSKPDLYQVLMSGLSEPTLLDKFTNMAQAHPELVQNEKQCDEQMKAIDNKKYGQ